MRLTVLIFMLFFLSPGNLLAKADVLVVLNKEEASAWLINPVTHEILAKLKVGDGPHEAAASPDGRTVVVCNYGVQNKDGNTLTVINVPQRKVVRTIDISPYRRPHGIQYFPDGKHVIVTSETEKKFVKVDVANGKVVSAFDSGGDTHMVSLDNTARTAYGTSIGDGVVSLVSLNGPERKPRMVKTGRGTEALAVHPKKEEVWVGNNQDHKVYVINPATLNTVAEIECGLTPIRLTFTSDGKHCLVSCLLSGDLAVIDSEKRVITRRIKLADLVIEEADWKGKTQIEISSLIERATREGARPIGVLVEPDNRFAYVANRGLDHIAVVDLWTWEVVRRIATGKGPDGMAWSRIE